MINQSPEENDPGLIRIMRSSLPAEVKQKIVERLIVERSQHEQRISAWVEELVAEAEGQLSPKG